MLNEIRNYLDFAGLQYRNPDKAGEEREKMLEFRHKGQEAPRVIGVKNSSMPVQDIQTFVSLGGEDHIVFNGPDEQFLGGRLMGAKAGIGGTYGAMPELFLKLNQLIADKDLEIARELQYAINAIIGKLTAAHGNMYGVIKEVLKINEGLNIGSVRSPLTPVTEEDRPVVEAAAALIRETKERFL